jgi:hypothetical protein
MSFPHAASLRAPPEAPLPSTMRYAGLRPRTFSGGSKKMKVL